CCNKRTPHLGISINSFGSNIITFTNCLGECLPSLRIDFLPDLLSFKGLFSLFFGSFLFSSCCGPFCSGRCFHDSTDLPGSFFILFIQKILILFCFPLPSGRSKSTI